MDTPSQNRQAIKKRLYLAGPLFSDAERQFNRSLKTALTPYFQVYLPQEDGGLMEDLINSGLSISSAYKSVFSLDLEAIRLSNILLIVLDGRAVDEGAAFELGVAFTLGKVCVGLQTDPRRLLPTGNNPMIAGSLSRVFDSATDLLEWTAEISRQPDGCELGQTSLGPTAIRTL